MKPRLSITGKVLTVRRMVKDAAGKVEKKTVETVQLFDWGDALTDAGILAGITFFTAMAGAGLTAVTYVKMIPAAAITAGLQFLTILGLKRKLIKPNGGGK